MDPPRLLSSIRPFEPADDIRGPAIALYDGLLQHFTPSNIHGDQAGGVSTVVEAKFCLVVHDSVVNGNDVAFELRVATSRDIWTSCQISIPSQRWVNTVMILPRTILSILQEPCSGEAEGTFVIRRYS